MEFIILGSEDDQEDSDTGEGDSDTGDSEIDTEIDSASNTDDSEPSSSDTADSDTHSDIDTDEDTETEIDTGPPLSPCQQAQLTNPDLVCCPADTPKNCMLSWPEDIDKYNGCCSQDLEQAIRCLSSIFYTPADCEWGVCGAPKWPFDFHHCGANRCTVPQAIAGLPANAPIYWNQLKDTFRSAIDSGCGDGYRDMWYIVPIPLIGTLEVSLLSGDEVYIQQVNSCSSGLCRRAVESPNRLEVVRWGNEQTALILVTQVNDNPSSASVIRFRAFLN